MKLSISLKIQRIIMIIPFVNAFVLFIWLYNYSKTSKKPAIFVKSLLVIFASTIPIVIIQAVLAKVFYDYSSFILVLNYISVYLIPFSMGFFLIKYQKALAQKSGINK